MHTPSDRPNKPMAVRKRGVDCPEPAQSINSKAKTASTAPTRAVLMLPARSINQKPLSPRPAKKPRAINTFSDVSEGEIQKQLHLSAKGPTYGIEIAEDQFHTLVALEADSVIFELKQGPYQPAQDKDFLYGFPQELSLIHISEPTRPY